MELLLLLAIYGAITGIIACAVVWLLSRFGRQPSFARVFICCAIALCLMMSVVSTGVAMLLAARRARLEGGEKAAKVQMNSPANR
jgi:hypothetical protein